MQFNLQNYKLEIHEILLENDFITIVLLDNAKLQFQNNVQCAQIILYNFTTYRYKKFSFQVVPHFCGYGALPAAGSPNRFPDPKWNICIRNAILLQSAIFYMIAQKTPGIDDKIFLIYTANDLQNCGSHKKLTGYVKKRKAKIKKHKLKLTEISIKI